MLRWKTCFFHFVNSLLMKATKRYMEMENISLGFQRAKKFPIVYIIYNIYKPHWAHLLHNSTFYNLSYLSKICYKWKELIKYLGLCQSLVWELATSLNEDAHKSIGYVLLDDCGEHIHYVCGLWIPPSLSSSVLHFLIELGYLDIKDVQNCLGWA